MHSICFTKKLALIFLTLCLGFALGVATLANVNNAYANEPLKLDSAYGYKISVSAGQGDLEGIPETISVAAGSQVDLSQYINEANIILPDSKYYIKGIRLAGHDYGEDAVDDLVFTATEDAQYVIAYGLKKNQVSYTVNYVDANGNQIADSQVFWGNPGDRPVIAYRYIDNYLPTAWNITGTLEEGKENVFNFEYNAAPGVTYTTVTVPGGAAPATPGGAVAPAGPDAVAEAAAAGEIVGEDGTPLAAPDQEVDINDNSNPLASGATNAESNGLNPWIIAGVALVVVAAIAVAIVAIVRKKKAAKA